MQFCLGYCHRWCCDRCKYHFQPAEAASGVPGMPYLAIPDSINGTVYTDYEGNATGLVEASEL